MRAARDAFYDICLVSIDFDGFKHYDRYLRCIANFGLYLRRDIIPVGREFVNLIFFCRIIILISVIFLQINQTKCKTSIFTG